jgi:rRNA-processing protein EBP2
MEIAARDNQESDEEEGDLDTAAKEKFGLRGIYERERIITRLNEIRANFYNRLSSQKLINNTKGRIPFSEHMTITNDKALEVPEALTVHDDIKREIAFYNMTRENVKKGMEILVQAKIPISRPDDFFAEMLKSDEHMAKVKSRLLQQQSKIKTFEEKQSRMENKKFHKAIKAYKQTERHSEKRQNVEQINTLKKKIKERGGEEVDEREFNKIFNGGSNQ